MFLSLVLQDYRIPVCAQLLVMIVIAGILLLLGFVFKPVSWLAETADFDRPSVQEYTWLNGNPSVP